MAQGSGGRGSGEEVHGERSEMELVTHYSCLAVEEIRKKRTNQV